MAMQRSSLPWNSMSIDATPVLQSYCFSRGLSIGKYSPRYLSLANPPTGSPTLNYYISPHLLSPTTLLNTSIPESSNKTPPNSIIRRPLSVIYARSWDSTLDGSLPSLSTISDLLVHSQTPSNSSLTPATCSIVLPPGASSITECSISGFVLYATAEHNPTPRSYHLVYLTPRAATPTVTWLPAITSSCIQPTLSTTTASVFGYSLLRNNLGVSAGYKIFVRSTAGEWTVVRRYSQIKALVDKLNCPPALALTKKDSKFSHISPTVIKDRIGRLNAILKILLTDEKYVTAVKDFLLPDDHAVGVKNVTPRVGAGQRRKSFFDRIVGDSGPTNEEEWVVVDNDTTHASRQQVSGGMPTEIVISVYVAAFLMALEYVPNARSVVAWVMQAAIDGLPGEARHAIGGGMGVFVAGLLMGAGIQSVVKGPTVMEYFLSGEGKMKEKGTLVGSGARVRERKKSILGGSVVTPDATSEVGFETEAENLGSPLPQWPDSPVNCWSGPDAEAFKVRGGNYLKDKIKVKSLPAAFPCRGVDLWLTDNAMQDIKRHPAVLGGRLNDKPTLIVNFLMPWGNLVSYFEIKKSSMPAGTVTVWDKFVAGDQKFRDARLKLLPVVVEGPWVCRKAIGGGNAPAVIGKALPVHYFNDTDGATGHFEADLDVCASSVARGILSIVKNHTKSITIDLVFILEAQASSELPEQVLGAYRLHSLDPSRCNILPPFKEGEEGAGKMGEGGEHE